MTQRKLSRRKMLAAAGAAGIASVVGAGAASSAPPKVKASSDAYRLVVLAGRPAGYWRLGDAAGVSTVKDEGPRQRDGKYLGPTKLGSPGAIAGDSDSSITLDGTSYVEIPDDPALSQPTSGQGLTVEAWMRPDRLDFAEDQPLKYIHWLGKAETGQSEWGFRFYTIGDSERSNRISAYLWNADGKLGAGAYFQDKLRVGQWLHIVACYLPGNAATVPPAGVQIFKDGVFRQGPPEKGTLYHNPPQWSITPSRGTAPLRLGTRDRKSFLIGGLDEVAIYPRVLTPEEIQFHYQIATGQRRLSLAELAKLKRLVGARN